MKRSITRTRAARAIQATSVVAMAALAAIGLAHPKHLADARVVPAIPLVTVASAPEARRTLPLLSHPRVDSWIKRFTTDLRGSFATYLDRMGKYDEMILAKLERSRMPQDLIYLAMIESGFNPRAQSPVKAKGLWQFMAPTAKQYGLKVTRQVDERTNPAKSTDAALKYLSSLHDRLGSWYLAAAAYNSGEGTVLRALKKATGRTRGTDQDYYRISDRLPKETRDYVPKLIAAAKIARAPARYGFSGD